MDTRLKRTDFWTLASITIAAIVGGHITVFYIVYLFWFQELIRTSINFIDLLLLTKSFKGVINLIQIAFGSFFILFIYVVFIILLFGFMLNWNNEKIITENTGILTFRNWYFNINLLVFLLEYLLIRKNDKDNNLKMDIFNQRHIILHISILLGALIQLALIPKIQIDNTWSAVLVISPFLLLKYFLSPLNH